MTISTLFDCANREDFFPAEFLKKYLDVRKTILTRTFNLHNKFSNPTDVGRYFGRDVQDFVVFFTLSYLFGRFIAKIAMLSKNFYTQTTII